MKSKKSTLFHIFTILFIFSISSNLLALKPVRKYWAYPSDYGIIYEKVKIITKDNIILNGWFIPCQDTTGVKHVGASLSDEYKISPIPNKKPTLYPRKKPTIIITNGDSGNMSWLIWHAHKYFPFGYNVLLFDWRGFGESDDWEFEKDILCVKEFILDIHGTIDYIKNRDDVDSSKVMLFGFSTGAYLIFGAVKDRPEIAAIGVRSLLSSFDDTMPLLKKLSPERNLHFPSDYPKEAEPINAAEKIKCPVFMVVGEKDFQTPPWMSKKVFDKLEGNKLLWIAKNAVHGGGNGPEYKYSEKFFPLFRTFINNSYSGYNYSWAKVSYSTDKSRVKHVVYELAQQAGFGYSWEKSESQTDSLCHNFVFNINIEKKSLAQALEDILNPIGLTYKIEDGSIVLFKK